MSEQRLAEIRKREQAATAGPWKFTGDSNDPFSVVVPDHQKHSFTSVRFSHDEDARFVANAREDVRWLLDEISRLRETMQYVHDTLAPVQVFGEPVNSTAIACAEVLRLALDGTQL